MRRIAVAIMGTISGLVLLFSYHTSTNSGGIGDSPALAEGTPSPVQTPSATSPTSSSAAPSSPTAPTSSAAPSSPTSPTTSATPAAAAGTFTGPAVSTRWGPVQVQITVDNGKITAAQAVEYPQNNGRDQQINAYAIPALNSEVLSAQSANIDAVSGATVTSDGYLQSLQSAIDQAHL